MKWLRVMRFWFMTEEEKRSLAFEFEAWEIFLGVTLSIFLFGLFLLGCKWAIEDFIGRH